MMRIQHPDNTMLDDLFCTTITWLAIQAMRLDPPRRWFTATRYGLVGHN